MQKKLIALAVASLAVAPAFAQSNVQISGSVDALVESFTNDGVGVGLGDATHKTSRLIFKGTEDLGNGYKAFFELEERFQLDTATEDDSGKRFKNKAWVGLSGPFGSVSAGRISNAMDKIYGGGKIGNIDTIADAQSRRAGATDRFDNGISYSSPTFAKMVRLNAAVALGDTAAAGNSVSPHDGGSKRKRAWDVSSNFTFGNAFVDAGYQVRGVDGVSTTPWKTYTVNGGYKFGMASAFVGYSHSKGYDTTEGRKQKALNIGADFAIGSAGKLVTTLGQYKTEDVGKENKLTKFGVGYAHNLSKRTQLIAAAAYYKNSDTEPYNGKDNTIGVQGGIRHAF